MLPAQRRRHAVQTSSESTAAEVEVILPAEVDLHARPAATFVRTAMRFSAKVRVVSGGREADAKSLLSVLALGAKRGTTLTLRADGEDAASAVDSLGTTIRELQE
jgi:phosphotransferase system HPr (HPr) family protein